MSANMQVLGLKKVAVFWKFLQDLLDIWERMFYNKNKPNASRGGPGVPP
jgi:hypothetical protein